MVKREPSVQEVIEEFKKYDLDNLMKLFSAIYKPTNRLDDI